MAIEFRDNWLAQFYEQDKRHRKIPSTLHTALFRKLQILDAAKQQCDLSAPPSNHFEHLVGSLSGYCSIRVNKQYRLLFRWYKNTAMDTYLDPHRYHS